MCSALKFLVCDSFGPDDGICLSGEGAAPEKVPESDWYPAGTDGTPYKYDSVDVENIDDSPDMFNGGL